MQNITKFLEITVYLIMFCMAGTFLLYQNRELNHYIITIKNDICNHNLFYESEQSYDDVKERKVSYSELISTLFGNPDYTIQINNVIILKDDYNYQLFDFSSIPQGEYIKSYQYDSSGNIVRVIYKS